jgi:dipeptidase E
MDVTGMAERLTGLLWDRPRTVFLGAGAGSMIVTRGLRGDQNDEQDANALDRARRGEAAPVHAVCDKTLELLDLVVRPHLTARSALDAPLDVPLYAIDDQSAVVVRDGVVRVVSEGEWMVLAPQGQEDHVAVSAIGL